MYSLTLTKSERDAIDWVGYRYSHGDDLCNLLTGCDSVSEGLPGDDDSPWETAGDVTFAIPENVAWSIAEIADESDHRWDCFGRDLVAKLESFLAQVV